MTTERMTPRVSRLGLRAARREPAAAQWFSILVVCTAHHCRSPLMDAVLAARSREIFGTGWRVESAGTSPQVGRTVHLLTGTALVTAGLAATVQRARQLEPELVRAADLVLTAERRHRAEVVRLVPAAVNRVFTLREFARLAGSVDVISSPDPVVAGQELVRRARQARADFAPVPPVDDDLVDPMGGGIEDFARCLSSVQQAVDSILGNVRPDRTRQS